MRISRLIAVLICLQALPTSAAPASDRGDGTLPESSRWSSFARLVYGRWDTKARLLRGHAPEARTQFTNCIQDAWFIGYSPLLRSKNAPCIDLARSAHSTEDDGTAPLEVKERFRAAFSNTNATSDYAGYRNCTTAAFEYHDTSLLEVCALALRPRERVLATLTDEERFEMWFGSCKKVLLADMKPVETEDTEGLKKPRREITEFERTQGRHCFRLMPALYEVRGMKKLSDYWTPEEQKALFQKSKQLGQN